MVFGDGMVVKVYGVGRIVFGVSLLNELRGEVWGVGGDDEWGW